MYHGDLRLGDTVDVKFCTVQSTGAPTTLAGSPVVSAYPGNSTTQLTAGITLTVDFDSVTGLHNVRVVASSGNGYATATNYALVITTGTVNSVSAVGYIVGTFSIENRSALMPASAGQTATVDSSGNVYADVKKLNSVAASAANLEKSASVMFRGTATGTTSSTTLIDSTLTQAATDHWKGRIIIFTSGTLLYQASDITAFDASLHKITFSAMTGAASGGDSYVII